MDVAGRVEEHDRPLYSANPDDWHNIAEQTVRALPYYPEKLSQKMEKNTIPPP